MRKPDLQDDDFLTFHDAPWVMALRSSLIHWYRKQARDLPWRRSRDPYAIWVSEIMLQQTQVSTVVPFFERFMKSFPTVEKLAAASEAAVLKRWEGLGYYRRARNLHRAAREVTDQYDGQVPRDSATLSRLPGSGQYTAGAILSIAFDCREPIVEANSRRVLSRLFAIKGDLSRQPGKHLLWDLAKFVLPDKNVGDFNQAMMELGSQCCQKQYPRCMECPVKKWCRAFQEGLQEELPFTPAQPKIQAVREVAVIVRKGKRVLVVQRPNDGRWAGMYDFPRFECSFRSKEKIRQLMVRGVHQQTGVPIQAGNKIGQIRYVVTRFRTSVDCYEAHFLNTGKSNRSENDISVNTLQKEQQEAGSLWHMQWATRKQIDSFPMSVPARRVIRLLEDFD